MRELVCPPRRMRFSFESRCRIVQFVLAGASPQAAAAACGASRATGYRLWRRYQQGGWAALRDRPPVPRYKRQRPGELVHVDIKRLGRFWTVGKAILGDRLTRSEGAGWQYLHLAIDDHSRLAYGELLPSESPGDCTAFL